jgi:hypothetical protein
MLKKVLLIFGIVVVSITGFLFFFKKNFIKKIENFDSDWEFLC